MGVIVQRRAYPVASLVWEGVWIHPRRGQHDGEHCEPSLGGHCEPSVGEQCGPMRTMMRIPPGPPYNAFGTHCVGFGSWHHLVDSETPERRGSTLVGGGLWTCLLGSPIWWTRGPPAPLGGLVDLRTSKYYKFPSGLWGPTGWTSLFWGPVLQKPQWTPWWTRSPPKSTTTFARFQDGFRQVRFWLSRLSLQFFSGQNHC